TRDVRPWPGPVNTGSGEAASYLLYWTMSFPDEVSATLPQTSAVKPAMNASWARFWKVAPRPLNFPSVWQLTPAVGTVAPPEVASATAKTVTPATAITAYAVRIRNLFTVFSSVLALCPSKPAPARNTLERNCQREPDEGARRRRRF